MALATILIASLLLFGCAQQTDWNVSYLTGESEEFSCAKLFLPTRDRVNGIDVEFVQTSESLHTYLQIHSHPVLTSTSNSKEIVVTLRTQEALCTGPSFRRQGGQKLLLSSSLQDFLLSSLKEGKSVTIELPGYKATIPAEGFEQQLYEMQHPPFDNPFRLPF